jgi:hypothetical protein
MKNINLKLEIALYVKQDKISMRYGDAAELME